jgi:hypothetical protein
MDPIESVRHLLSPGRRVAFDAEVAALLDRWRARAVAELEPRPIVEGEMLGFLLDDEDEPPDGGVAAVVRA